MNPVSSGTTDAYKDAVFVSPHKFVGGVNTPGVLIAKKVRSPPLSSWSDDVLAESISLQISEVCLVYVSTD